MSGFLHGLYSVLWLQTLGNNVAWLEDLVSAALVAWVSHKLGVLPKVTAAIGKRLAAWWDEHHGDLAVERHKQALREHAQEIRRMRQ